MKNRLTTLLEEYRQRPEAEADQSMWSFVAAKDPYLFSHHPATPAFREHVWKIGGLYFCKGCVTTFAGIVAGGGFYLFTGWLRWFTDLQVGAIFVALLAPTILIHLWRFPRWCRLLSRFLLGFLMVSAFLMLFVTGSWLVRGAIVAAYFVSKVPMERKRRRENRKILQS